MTILSNNMLKLYVFIVFILYIGTAKKCMGMIWPTKKHYFSQMKMNQHWLSEITPLLLSFDTVCMGSPVKYIKYSNFQLE